jgi:hypothetical protein
MHLLWHRFAHNDDARPRAGRQAGRQCLRKESFGSRCCAEERWLDALTLTMSIAFCLDDCRTATFSLITLLSRGWSVARACAHTHALTRTHTCTRTHTHTHTHSHSHSHSRTHTHALTHTHTHTHTHTQVPCHHPVWRRWQRLRLRPWFHSRHQDQQDGRPTSQAHTASCGPHGSVRGVNKTVRAHRHHCKRALLLQSVRLLIPRAHVGILH